MSLLSAAHGNFSGSGNSAHRFVDGGIVVELVLLERSPKQLKFQVSIKNTGEKLFLLSVIPSGLMEIEGRIYRLTSMIQVCWKSLSGFSASDLYDLCSETPCNLFTTRSWCDAR